MGHRYPALWLAVLILAAAAVPGGAETVFPWANSAGDSGPLVRMSLGFTQDHTAPAPGELGQSDLSGSTVSKAQCRKWSAMARRLGETYAGHAVRQSVVRRVCGLLGGERTGDIWDWPWNGLTQGHVVPPRPYRDFGAWEIRCGLGSYRRRCALLYTADAARPQPPKGERQIVTHFVVDMVGGREILLWRMFVPNLVVETATPVNTSRARADGNTTGTPVRIAGAVAAVPVPLAARYVIDGIARQERFPACAAPGCLMEADMPSGGRVATELWEGRPVSVQVDGGTQPPQAVTLPANGFRAALKELIRLRHAENRRAPAR
jgi:hypothetical protein